MGSLGELELAGEARGVRAGWSPHGQRFNVTAPRRDRRNQGKLIEEEEQ
jgi:hypothetical protein